MSLPYKGWAQLEVQDAGDDEDVLVPLHFPLNVEGRYVIGSRDDASISLLVPEFEFGSESEKFPVEATLMVDGNGQVFLERADGRNAMVVIGGNVLEKGTMSLRPLTFGTVVSFGGSVYVFKKVTDKTLQQANELLRCRVCDKDGDGEGSVVLKCGHTMCGTCREACAQQRYRTRRQMADPQAARQQPGPPAIAPIGVAIYNGLVQCSVCKMRVSSVVANTAMTSLALNQAIKLVSDFGEANSNRPVCEACHNEKGGLISSRDFHECQSCRQVLCAPCVLQGHRDHVLKRPVDRMRELDMVDQKLREANQMLHVFKQQCEDLRDDAGLAQVRATGGKQNRRITSSLDSLENKLAMCDHQLSRIRERKRELARGWDETSKKMLVVFRQLGDEFRELVRRLREMRDGDTSWSFESSSDEEDNTTTLTPATTPTIGSSTTTSSGGSVSTVSSDNS